MQNAQILAAGATELEALPESASRLISIISEEDWLIGDIVHTIQHDQVLTGKLLRLANSAAVGARGKIETVGDAVMRVGTGPVLALAVSSAVQSSLRARFLELGAAEETLWRHSVASALIVQTAGKHGAHKAPPEAFVAALLHDIGFLSLERWLVSLEDEAERAEAKAEMGERDHAVLGGLLAERWQLSEPIQEAIVSHHDPGEAFSDHGRLLAHFVCLADCGARIIGAGFGPETPRMGKETAQTLGVTRERFDAICAESEAGLTEILELYS